MPDKPARKNPLSLHLDPDAFLPATEEEKKELVIMRESVTYWQDAAHRLRQNKVAMVSLFIILLTLVFAFILPSFYPYSYEEQIRGSENLRPLQYSESEVELKEAGESVFPHFLGTDTLGRDLTARLMLGTRISLLVGLIASGIILIIGTLYGSISGLAGGRVDLVMMRIVEIIYTIPDILLIILLMVTLRIPLNNLFDSVPFLHGLRAIGSGLISIFIVFSLLYWVSMARIVRGQVLMLKEQEFVTAARASGGSNARIIRRHLIPNTIGTIVVTTSLQIPSAIFVESFLSFLGIGVQAPMASLGSLASSALGGIYSYTYRLVAPAVAISIIILTFNLFGDGLRDALDPRLKK